MIENHHMHAEQIADAVDAACREIEDRGFRAKSAGIFADWNGGKFYRSGVKIGDDVLGYRLGHVATLEKNPSEALKEAVDAAGDVLRNCLARIAKDASNESEQEVAE